MTRIEFIEMMNQDIATDKEKATLQSVVEAMNSCMIECGVDEIDSKGKTPQDLYKKMTDHAKKNSKNGSFMFSPKATLEFFKGYLGIKATATANQATAKPEPTAGIIDLEDFF